MDEQKLHKIDWNSTLPKTITTISNGKTYMDITDDNAARLVDCYSEFARVPDVAGFMDSLFSTLRQIEIHAGNETHIDCLSIKRLSSQALALFSTPQEQKRANDD